MDIEIKKGQKWLEKYGSTKDIVRINQASSGFVTYTYLYGEKESERQKLEEHKFLIKFRLYEDVD